MEAAISFEDYMTEGYLAALDAIEDMLPRSYAYQQAVQQFFLPAPTVSTPRFPKSTRKKNTT